MLRSSYNSVVSLLKALKDYSLYRNALYLIASTFFGAGMGFFFWIVAARLYPVKDFGLASALISVIGLISSLSILGLNTGLIRYLPEINDKSKLINTCISVVTIISFTISMIFLLSVDILAPPLKVIKENPVIVLLFILFCVLPSNNALLRMGVFIGFKEAKYSFIQTIFLFMRILILPFFVALGAIGIFISFGMTAIVAYIVGIYILYKIYNHKIKFFIDIKLLKDILPYSFGNYLAGLLAGLPMYALPILVINTLGAEANAYFYAAWMTSYLLITISDNISTSLFAEGSHDPNNVYKTARKAFKFSLSLTIFLTIIIYLFGKYILLILGKQFEQESLQLLRILIFANIFYIINSIYVAIKRVEKNVKAIVFTYGFLSIFTLILSYVLIHPMGLMGIGLSWLLSNIILSGIILNNIRYSIFR